MVLKISFESYRFQRPSKTQKDGVIFFFKVSADIPAALGIGSNTNSVIPLNIEISPQ